MLYSFLFILGAAVGSFLNVVISRLPKEESIVFPASHCPQCQHDLGVLDLIPLISFIFLKKKCRYCGQLISPRYFAVELLTGLFFVLTYCSFPNLADYVFIIIFVCLALAVAFMDLETQEIPEILLVLMGMVALLYAVFSGVWVMALLGGGVGFLFFFLLSKVSLLIYKREALGFGDVELGLALGIFLGWPWVVQGIFWAYFFAGIVSIVLLLLRKVTLQDGIAFAPFLILGAFYVFYFGSPLCFW